MFSAGMVLIFAVMLGVPGYVFKETLFGVYVHAVGNNDEATRCACIKVGTIKIAAAAIVVSAATIAGILAASHILSVDVFSGGGLGSGTLLLESIAAP